ncbi:MAG TPA: alpha/beta fold hydrolase [Thermoanaerobaculia bacterium]|nr:alpha/beta fold hydrolase [Thermoanaerobaculia bacterium]
MSIRKVLPAIVLCLLGGGCYRPQPTSVPLRTLPVASALPEGGERCLVVLLPGRGDKPEDFVTNDFAVTLRQAGSTCEVLAVDAHLGYYYEGIIDTRLREDVIVPALARGIEEVWLVGISLGGLGSILYTRDHPGEVAGVVLLAPFLGPDEVVNEVEEAGGLSRWTPTEPLAERDLRRLWLWLKRYDAAAPRQPPIYLAYGQGDRFARKNALMAEALPEDHVFVLPGGHTWRTWRRLWSAVLDAGVVPGKTAGRLRRATTGSSR